MNCAPKRCLYEALHQEQEADAHGRYNGLIQRLVSFERALEHEHFSRVREEERQGHHAAPGFE